MNLFHLYIGNRLEILAERLADMLRTPLSSPFAAEIIMVQNRGMEKWVSLELARIFGILAHVRFPSPHAFIDDLFQAVLPGLSEVNPFSPEIAAWRLMKALSAVSPENRSAAFAPIRQYVSGAVGGLKRWQLSVQLAQLFDQYLTFRPKMVLDWEAGQEGGWQAELFRDIARLSPHRHRAALAGRFAETLLRAASEGDERPVFLPSRVALFGISYLPPLYLNILKALSQFTEIHLFLMNPSGEFWGDIVSTREERRIIKRHPATAEQADLHLAHGNRLLADMGTMGRNFFSLVSELDAEILDDFREPEGEQLLRQLQRDLLTLHDRGAEHDEKTRISIHDRSLQVHSCHSPMREMEVLLDHLLDMLEADPRLEPREILVMTPDIELMSPYIQAVFDLPPHDPRRIPFSIADRSALSQGRVVRTFLDMLQLDESRFNVAAVMSILENPAVHQRFELRENDLELIRRWIADTRIRWGIDAEYRGQMNLPKFEENTWDSGLKQLLLGYAWPGEEYQLFQGIPPYSGVEGQEAQILGKLSEYIAKLCQQTLNLKRKRNIARWAADLTAMLEYLFTEDSSSEAEIRLIRKVINALTENAEQAEFDAPVEARVILSYLNQAFADKKADHLFLSGGVTFCAMLPMRSVPFKVICLVGIDSDSYPRKTRTRGFDLMAAQPLRGDRSQRDEDRYLFLETLISARERLYISYVGQSARDNTEIPPSVLVSDLLDYIDRGFCLGDDNKQIIPDHIVTKHRLQAFNRAYFDESGDQARLFSYSAENYQAAQQLPAQGKPPTAFIQRPLSEPEPEFKQLDLKTLYRFFRNPAEFLLTRRLGLKLDEKQLVQDDYEPFELNPLELYSLSQDLLKAMLADKDADTAYQVKKAVGVLPHGILGQKVFREKWRETEEFFGNVLNLADIREQKEASVELTLAGFHLTGTIPLAGSQQYIHYRPAKIKGSDYLQAWLHHLALNAALSGPDKGQAGRSFIVGKDARCALKPTANSEELLISLLKLYWEGLKQPLPFFPTSSWTYAELVYMKRKDPVEALNVALSKWNGNPYFDQSGGDQDNPYYHLCFRSACPLDASFQSIATQVYAPLIEAWEEIV